MHGHLGGFEAKKTRVQAAESGFIAFFSMGKH